MAGSRKGGEITRNKLKKSDPNYYRKIGAIGGKKGKKDGVKKGFALMPIEKIREAGRKGGLRRGNV